MVGKKGGLRQQNVESCTEYTNILRSSLLQKMLQLQGKALYEKVAFYVLMQQRRPGGARRQERSSGPMKEVVSKDFQTVP